jgi:hypothetical protein
LRYFDTKPDRRSGSTSFASFSGRFSQLFKVAGQFYFENSAKICDWLTTKNENSVVVVRRESRSDSLVCCANREFYVNPDFYYRIFLFFVLKVGESER